MMLLTQPTAVLLLGCPVAWSLQWPPSWPPSWPSAWKNYGLTAPPYLSDLAKADGKLWFGTATDIPGPEQQDQNYMSIMTDTDIFGCLTPANYMKVCANILPLPFLFIFALSRFLAHA